MTYLIFDASPWIFTVVLLVLLALSIELPYRLGQRVAQKMEHHREAFTAAQAGLLTLASFVLGLSFSQAEGRFDARRELVVKEANAIGTTWLRADQLSASQRDSFRKLLTDYTAARLQAYQSPLGSSSNGTPLYQRTLDQSTRDQDAIWAIASSELTAKPTSLGLSLLMQSLNNTIDVSTEQLQALTNHVPTAVVVLTVGLVTLGGLSIGIRFAANASRPMLLSIIYVVANVVVIGMMIDYDRPQTGLIRINLKPLQVQLEAMQLPTAAK